MKLKMSELPSNKSALVWLNFSHWRLSLRVSSKVEKFCDAKYLRFILGKERQLINLSGILLFSKKPWFHTIPHIQHKQIEFSDDVLFLLSKSCKHNKKKYKSNITESFYTDPYSMRVLIEC